ncbi:hypothetical protein [Bdellovibrio sp. HCB337]|uniref:hypothetical protein n=1 Tax=Bdellovibrio sp. HCB337 TaxID=3394358 RepID=UPI0039A66F99
MKNKFLTFVLLLSTAILTNCAKSDRSNNNNVNAYGGSCGMAGYVSTTYGCVPQGNCPVGMGQYNGTCVAGGNTGIMGGNCPVGSVSTSYGCLPQGACQMGYAQYNGTCIQATMGGGYGGYCGAGQVKTAAGCVPQNTCPAGYGYAVGNYGGSYGAWCLPQVY